MKKRIVPKTTLILLLFTLLLAWSAVLPGRADSLIKSKEFTTRTFMPTGTTTKSSSPKISASPVIPT